MILGVVAADLWVLANRNRTTPISTAAAIERFRQAEAQPATPTTIFSEGPAPSAEAPAPNPPTATATTVAPSPSTTSVEESPTEGAEATVTRPTPGVYTYDTHGFETFGSSRHDYPSTTNAVVTMSHGCGWTFDHLVLEEHRDTYTMCTSSTDVELTRWRFYRSFMGFALDELYMCAHASLRPDAARVGETTTFRCYADDEDRVEMRMTNLGRTSLTIDGAPVPAIHLQGEGEIIGGPTGRIHVELWIDDQTGLRLRERRVVDADVNAIGTSTYHEEAEFALQSLTPHT